MLVEQMDQEEGVEEGVQGVQWEEEEREERRRTWLGRRT